MFKMKSLLCIVAVFSLALVSCTERLPESTLPNDNGSDVITMIKATVEPLQLKGYPGVGNYSWNESHIIGIYGTGVGFNEQYLPVQSTLGDSEAFFFGNEVGGDLTIYMPYLEGGIPAGKEGRVTVPAVQKYYADPFDHLMYNSEFLAYVTGNEVNFDFHAGLVKVVIEYDIENITSVNVLVGNLSAGGEYNDYCVGDLSITTDVEQMLLNGASELTVAGFPNGVNSTVGNPLVVWAAMAPGEYENFVVEISNGDMTIAAPVEGPFVVEKCAVSKAVVAKKIDHNNGVGDFESENGNFNEGSNNGGTENGGTENGGTENGGTENGGTNEDVDE